MAIEKNGAIIVDRIYKTKACEKRITAEEMNAVIEERDAALSQVTACICKSIYLLFPRPLPLKNDFSHIFLIQLSYYHIINITMVDILK